MQTHQFQCRHLTSFIQQQATQNQLPLIHQQHDQKNMSRRSSHTLTNERCTYNFSSSLSILNIISSCYKWQINLIFNFFFPQQHEYRTISGLQLLILNEKEFPFKISLMQHIFRNCSNKKVNFQHGANYFYECLVCSRHGPV